MSISSDSATVMAAIKATDEYIEKHINSALEHAYGASNVPESIVPRDKVTIGKVRDIYYGSDVVVLISTDRQSGFDRQLAQVPFKGQVLNLTSKWWFEQSKEHLSIPNAVITIPDPNVTIASRCTPMPVEFVMRGYMTGSTSTSIWQNYAKGVREYCGHNLPEGLKKNQKLPMGNLLTPTTKDDLHDELISAEEIVSRGMMTQEEWAVCADYAHRLFAFGQEVAATRGLILVDTKYEFGRLPDGSIALIDEVHTPDSSRYWIADTYEARFSSGENPDNIDKEFLRLWFTEHCDPYKDEILPTPPPSLVSELSRRYVMLYEMITGQQFEFPAPESVESRVISNLASFFQK